MDFDNSKNKKQKLSTQTGGSVAENIVTGIFVGLLCILLLWGSWKMS